MTTTEIKFEPQVSMRNRLKSLKIEEEEIHNQRLDLLTEAFKEACLALFAAYPDLQNFAWAQYGGEYDDSGPYHGINTILTNYDEDQVDDHYWCGGAYNETAHAQKIRSELESLDSELLMEVLGGYNVVHVNRQGVSVVEFDGY